MIKPRPLSEDQYALIEALVRSPVMGALTQLIDNYKAECYGVLTTSKDPNHLFETQGRLIGANVVTELPKIIAHQRQKQKEAEAKEQEKKEHIQNRKRKLLEESPIKKPKS